MLRDHGHIAYLAGGCVRDILFGVHPTDYDVATDAKPTQIEGYFRKTASVGASFGVMLVRDFGFTIEVATFRSDGVYSDARRPDSIEYSSPMEDAKRRDFTINALFMDPLAEDEDHNIIDYVCGITDVRDRVLRAVGNPEDRLREDHLRALRAVRFASKYNLTIEQRTANAIKDHASELSGVSIERVGEEMRKMLMHSSRADACRRIDELGLDDAIFSDAHRFDATVMSRIPEVVEYSAALCALAIGRGFDARDQGCLIDDITAHYRRSLDLTNIDRDGMRQILTTVRSMLNDWDSMSEAQRKRLLSQDWTSGSLALLGAIDSQRGAIIHAERERLQSRFGGLAPVALVSGSDLIERGFQPSKQFKTILDRVYDEQLEGRVSTKEQAMEFASNLAAKQA